MTSGRVQDLVNREDDPVKLLAFEGELLSTSCSEGVVPRPPIVLGRTPFRFDPAVEQQSLQGRVEGALAHLKHLLGDGLEVLRDAVAVLTAREQGLEDQEI